ncbi:MAG: hypothetical protein EA422_14925 [Gemmatimonadales bacterium]|nr:MAG: hypothetical protein EA422_14925 [Gemmatimonadales bacterium]
MNPSPALSSSTRISDLGTEGFQVEALPPDRWRTGDYVVVECGSGPGVLELQDGRLIAIESGHQMVGVLGHRRSTLEVSGSWEEAGARGEMELLTAGGLLGRCTSRSAWIPTLLTVRYLGHTVRCGVPLRMSDFIPEPDISGDPDPGHPSVLITGTSMSCGKTGTARAVIRRLTTLGFRVVAAKLTGAARLRDIQTMADAGAVAIFDFVDGGLPSTVCSEEELDRALRIVLGRVAATPADVAVFELGASPHEPYLGKSAIQAVRSRVQLSILCASDAYAVVGFLHRMDLPVDLVTGIAANTAAGEDLVRHLTGIQSLNIHDPARMPELDALLRDRFGGGAPW